MVNLIPFLSVVFVTHGDRIEVVKRLLDSIAKYTNQGWIEFICVDNGSVPSAASFIGERHPWVHVLRNAENLGTSRAYNAGIRKSHGDFVMIINDDTVIPEGMLERIRAFLETDLIVSGEPQGRGVGSSRTALVGDGIALGLKKNVDEYQALRLRIVNTSKRHPHRPVRATFIGTGNLVIRRSLLDKVGLYDENYFAGNEDMDLSLRLKRAHARIYHYPDFYIYHIHVYRKKKSDWADFILARRLSDIYYAQKFFPFLAPFARIYALRNFKKRTAGKIDSDTFQKSKRILFTKRGSYYEIQKELIRDGIKDVFERYFSHIV